MKKIIGYVIIGSRIESFEVIAKNYHETALGFYIFYLPDDELAYYPIGHTVIQKVQQIPT